MNPLNADQREQQLTRLLEAVSKERDAALAQLDLERREKGDLLELCNGIVKRHRDVCAGKDPVPLARLVKILTDKIAALTPQESPDGQ
jgi:hypothetical protein